MNLEKCLSDLSSDLKALNEKRVSNLRTKLRELKTKLGSIEKPQVTFFDFLNIKTDERKNTRTLCWLLKKPEGREQGSPVRSKILELFLNNTEKLPKEICCLEQFTEGEEESGSIDDEGISKKLNQGEISSDIKDKIKKENQSFSNPSQRREEEWEIVDEDKDNTYIIRKENGKLRIYEQKRGDVDLLIETDEDIVGVEIKTPNGDETAEKEKIKKESKYVEKRAIGKNPRFFYLTPFFYEKKRAQNEFADWIDGVITWRDIVKKLEEALEQCENGKNDSDYNTNNAHQIKEHWENYLMNNYDHDNAKLYIEYKKVLDKADELKEEFENYREDVFNRIGSHFLEKESNKEYHCYHYKEDSLDDKIEIPGDIEKDVLKFKKESWKNPHVHYEIGFSESEDRFGENPELEIRLDIENNNRTKFRRKLGEEAENQISELEEEGFNKSNDKFTFLRKPILLENKDSVEELVKEAKKELDRLKRELEDPVEETYNKI